MIRVVPGIASALSISAASSDGPRRMYYDRTHRGNDWDEVRRRLRADIATGKKTEVQATDEMLGLLKDKYTRQAPGAERYRTARGGGGGGVAYRRQGARKFTPVVPAPRAWMVSEPVQACCCAPCVCRAWPTGEAPAVLERRGRLTLEW